MAAPTYEDSFPDNNNQLSQAPNLDAAPSRSAVSAAPPQASASAPAPIAAAPPQAPAIVPDNAVVANPTAGTHIPAIATQTGNHLHAASTFKPPGLTEAVGATRAGAAPATVANPMQPPATATVANPGRVPAAAGEASATATVANPGRVLAAPPTESTSGQLATALHAVSAEFFRSIGNSLANAKEELRKRFKTAVELIDQKALLEYTKRYENRCAIRTTKKNVDVDLKHTVTIPDSAIYYITLALKPTGFNEKAKTVLKERALAILSRLDNKNPAIQGLLETAVDNHTSDNDNEEYIEVLVKKQINVVNALKKAIEQQKSDIIPIILSTGSNITSIRADTQQKIEIIKSYINVFHLQIDSDTEFLSNLLDILSVNDQEAFTIMSEYQFDNQTPNLYKILLAKIGNINKIYNNGGTVLLYAVQRNDIDLVNFLFEKYKNIDTNIIYKGPSGMFTVLDLAKNGTEMYNTLTTRPAKTFNDLIKLNPELATAPVPALAPTSASVSAPTSASVSAPTSTSASVSAPTSASQGDNKTRMDTICAILKDMRQLAVTYTAQNPKKTYITDYVTNLEKLVNTVVNCGDVLPVVNPKRLQEVVNKVIAAQEDESPEPAQQPLDATKGGLKSSTRSGGISNLVPTVENVEQGVSNKSRMRTDAKVAGTFAQGKP